MAISDAQYPAALKSYTDKVDNSDEILAAHMNSLQDEIMAMETELGTALKGSETDLKARLARSLDAYGALKSDSVMASAIADNSVSGEHLVSSGITSGHLSSGCVTSGAIHPLSISGCHVIPSGLVSGNFTSACITSAAIEPSGISDYHLTSGCLMSGHIEQKKFRAKQSRTCIPLLTTSAAIDGGTWNNATGCYFFKWEYVDNVASATFAAIILANDDYASEASGALRLYNLTEASAVVDSTISGTTSAIANSGSYKESGDILDDLKTGHYYGLDYKSNKASNDCIVCNVRVNVIEKVA